MPSGTTHRPDEMIHDLKLKNYRSFQSYELVDLAPVNLLVGKNNSGKTSILEAIHFLASGGDPYVLREVARRRGEVNVHRGHDHRHRRLPDPPDVSHLFRGHRFGPGSELAITSDGGRNAVCMTVEDDDKDFHPDQQSLFGREMENAKLLAVHIKGIGTKSSIVLPATDDGSLHLTSRTVRTSGLDALPTSPVRFVTAASLKISSMQGMWDAVVLAGREAEVEDAMKLIEHNLTSIYFTGAYGFGDAVLGFQPGTRRVAIGSHGEGTRRLLALALSLTQLSGGILLVDEIDTGLHWTVLEDMWKLVIEWATRANIQVFATTHSFDCIRGLAALAASHPELASKVSVQKIERALDRAVGFDIADVKRAVDDDIELR